MDRECFAQKPPAWTSHAFSAKSSHRNHRGHPVRHPRDAFSKRSHRVFQTSESGVYFELEKMTPLGRKKNTTKQSGVSIYEL